MRYGKKERATINGMDDVADDRAQRGFSNE